MITPISTLKRWFANFKKPTQEQFWAWLDSYWHKSEKIPMDTIDGLENAIRGTASADQLRNHLTDSQAHQELFATKVDKEAGKTLTSNDYTNEEKRTNQANAKKRVVNLTVTGDVDKIITITFADGTAIQAPFTDKDTLPENLADIKLNSLNFDHNTGVLTGLRSDGQQLTVSLDGRYALLGHTHPEYAYRTHRHHWDNIDGKPALATEGKIREEIEKIQVGGRNYVLKSNDRHNSLIKTYPISQEFIKNVRKGDHVVVSLFIEFTRLVALTGNGRIGAEFSIYYVDNTMDYVWSWVNFSASDIGKGYKGRFSFVNQINPNKEILRITDNIGLHVQCEVEGLSIGMPKVEIGNTPTDWSAAPEDIKIGTVMNGTRQVLPYEDVVYVTTTVPNCDLQLVPDRGSVAFRKVFTGGSVTFTCLGKTIVYTGDTDFNGGDGSTAVVSVYGNKCYIDIRNV